MAVAFKESAAPAGIRVDIERHTPEDFWSSVWGQHPLTVLLFWGRASADQVLNEIWQSESIYNMSKYVNPPFDQLIIQARAQDLEGQKETYAEIQRTLIEDVPRLVIAWEPWMYGARKEVRSVAAHPLGWAIVQDAWLDD